MRRLFSVLGMIVLGWNLAVAAELPSRQVAVLDGLFERLGHAADATESEAVAAQIEHVWLQADGPTLELLMRRALQAMQSRDYDAALNLLNHVVRLAPDWAEAWNKRATVRFLLDDDAGSLADIGRTLELEPRHFGALSGEAMILERAGRKAEALQAYRQVLTLAPQWPDLKARVEKLSIDVEGQGI